RLCAEGEEGVEILSLASHLRGAKERGGRLTREEGRMLDQQELSILLQQRGFDAASLRLFAYFENGSSYLLRETGTAVSETWRTLQRLVQVMGYWPLIVGETATLEDIAGRDVSRSPQDVIKAGLYLLTVEQILRKCAKRYQAFYHR